MKRKSLLVGLIGLALVSASTVAISNFAKAEQQTEELKDEYCYKTFLEIPEKTITKGTVTKNAKIIVTSPSGLTYESNKLTLEEIGQYTVTYRAMFDGFPEEETDTFYVYKPTYYSKKSTITYGANDKYFGGKQGLNISLKKDDVFEYGEIIDLNKYSSKTLVGVGLNPATPGVSEVSGLTVRFTDAYDDNTYIDFVFTNPNIKDKNAYVGFGSLKAGTSANPDILMGNESLPSGGAEKWHVNDGYGSYVRFSFDGLINDGKYTGGELALTELAYDLSLNHALSPNKVWCANSTRYPSDGSKLIADFGRTSWSEDAVSKMNVVPVTESPWATPFEGFSQNKVKLSIWATGYSGNECGIFVSSIAGADFTQEKSYDTLSPLLTVDQLGFEDNNLPKAKVGTPFKVFEAFGSDDFTRPSNIAINVYYSLKGFKLNSVPVIDGAFTPFREGTYLIEYLVTDGSNQKATKLLEIEALNEIQQPQLDDISGIVSSAKCGATITLPTATGSVYTGNPKFELSVKVDEEDVKLTNNSFLVNKVGTYTVTYTLKDYIGQKDEKVFNIVATADDKPVIVSKPILNPAFIVGANYILPKAYAYNYKVIKNGNPEKIEGTIAVREDGVRKNLTNGKYTPSDCVQDYVTVIYSFFTASGGSNTMQENVPLVKLTDNRIRNDEPLKFFFTGDNVTKTINENALTLNFSDDDQVRFINPLATQNADFVLRINSETLEKAQRLNLYFNDIEDPDKSVKVSYISNGTDQLTSRLSINDGKEYEVNSNFSGKGSYSFDFKFDEMTKTVTTGLTRISFDTFQNGEEFVGFNKSQAFLTIELVGVDGNCKLDVAKLCNQNIISSNRGDRIAPNLIINGNVKHRYGFGEEVETFVAYACDVYQPSSQISLTISDEDGNPIKLMNGQEAFELDCSKTYKFKMDKYTKYYAKYNCQDAVGNKTYSELCYTCEDEIKPTVNGDFRTVLAKLNKEVNFGTYKFSDNCSRGNDLTNVVYVFNPNGTSKIVRTGHESSIELKYKFNMVGNWRLYVVAYDKAGNSSYNLINVVVK